MVHAHGETADVVVVGGGVVGAACAYHLAEVGLQVVLLEREAIASGASTHATGGFSLLGTDFRQGPHLELGIHSDRLTRDLIPHLESLTGVDVRYQRPPGLRLALDDEEAEFIKAALTWQRDLVQVEWLDGADTRKIEPRLSPSVLGAAYESETAQVDSARLTLAFAMGLEKLGGRIVLRAATGLLRAGDQITGIEYSGGGKIASGSVVLAMGVWSGLASKWIKYHLPLYPLKGERILLKYPGEPLRAIIFSPKRGHMISLSGGELSVGSTGGRDFDSVQAEVAPEWQPQPSDSMPTQTALLELVQRAIDILPSASEAEVVQQLAGVRPMTPDRMPLLGPAPSTSGLYLATGHGTKGVHLAAGTAKVITDLITTGISSLPVDIGEFSPTRRIDPGLLVSSLRGSTFADD